MWFKEYKDYPIDSPLKKDKKDPGSDFSGCEMNEPNGWGETFTPKYEPRKKSYLRKLLEKCFPW